MTEPLSPEARMEARIEAMPAGPDRTQALVDMNAMLVAHRDALDAARAAVPDAALDVCRLQTCRWHVTGPHHPHGEDDMTQPVYTNFAALAATATPDPAAPDLRSSAAWLVHRWDGNRTVEPDALRADIAVLRSALRGPWNNPHQLAPTPDPAAVAYDLDAAWAEAEAALPEGWWFSALSRGHDGYAAKAHDGTVIDGRVASLRRGYGPTPAAALRAIAAMLREGTR